MKCQGRLVCALLLAVVATSGCKQSDGTQGGTAASKNASHPARKPVDPFPPAPRGDVYVDGVTLEQVDVGAKKEMRYSGSIHNTTDKPIEGVQLNITLATSAGAGIGGQTTEFYFQPPLAPNKTVPLHVQLPSVPLPADVGPLAAKIDVLQVLKSAVPATVQSASPAAPAGAQATAARTPVTSAGVTSAPQDGAKETLK